jgi:MgtC family protein
MNTISLEIAGRLALAALTGLAVGVEREWSGHASGPRARFGGVRTFLLLGLIGGIGGWFAAGAWIALGVALVAGAALLAVLAYVVASQQTRDRDGTTEVAALLVLATGALCGLGYGSVGSGVAAVAVNRSHHSASPADSSLTGRHSRTRASLTQMGGAHAQRPTDRHRGPARGHRRARGRRPVRLATPSPPLYPRTGRHSGISRPSPPPTAFPTSATPGSRSSTTWA